MFRLMYMSKLFSLISLVWISMISLALSISAQEKASAHQSSTSISILDSTREQDGLIGPVRRVRTETAKLSLDSGKLIEGPHALLETTLYDVKGNRIENAYFPVVSNSSTGKEKYKYDDKGNVTEMVLQDSSGSVMSVETYRYEFDAVGNWTKMTTSLVVYEGGQKSYEPTEITYRTISYYFNETIAKLDKPASSPTSAQVGSVAANTAVGDKAVSTLSPAGTTAANSETMEKRLPVPLSGLSLPDNALAHSNGNGGLLAPTGTLNLNRNPVAAVDDPPPPASSSPTPSPTPKPQARLISSSVVNSKLISLPKPEYPEMARRAGVTGTVTVDVSIDVEGKVVAAHATSGPPILRGAAVEAARRARFSPTLLSGHPMNVSGIITFNFSSVQ